MMSRNQLHKVAGVAIAVLFGASGIIMGSANHFPFALPAATATAAGGGGDQATAKMHLGEAIKALQAGDTAGAKMHAQAAQDSL